MPESTTRNEDPDFDTPHVECPYCLAGPGSPCIDMRSGWRSTEYGTGLSRVSHPGGVGGVAKKKMHPERRWAVKDRA